MKNYLQSLDIHQRLFSARLRLDSGPLWRSSRRSHDHHV